uniref:Kappa-isophellitoxin-Tst1a n=1 Tax=Telmatactis stephensoni TaxID=2835637 RepID=K1A_TELST
ACENNFSDRECERRKKDCDSSMKFRELSCPKTCGTC